MDLADVVNQSEQAPLYIHFPFRAQRESVHVLLHADVGLASEAEVLALRPELNQIE